MRADEVFGRRSTPPRSSPLFLLPQDRTGLIFFNPYFIVVKNAFYVFYFSIKKHVFFTRHSLV